jgi:preprotein translocase subunit SecG
LGIEVDVILSRTAVRQQAEESGVDAGHTRETIRQAQVDAMWLESRNGRCGSSFGCSSRSLTELTMWDEMWRRLTALLAAAIFTPSLMLGKHSGLGKWQRRKAAPPFNPNSIPLLYANMDCASMARSKGLLCQCGYEIDAKAHD